MPHASPQQNRPLARRCLLASAALLAIIAACSGPIIATPAQPAVTAAPAERLAAPAGRLAAMTPARVTRVVDGDTIHVLADGMNYTVRYIGIDTPETVDPNQAVQPYGKEASLRNSALVASRGVYLEKDVSETDRFGRLLRYVWLDERTMVNALLVAEGYA
ncbi:MAG: nuclease [Dehalococcoidia bacterium]|nr:nuclease [Dehalococcoidia bacterium]